MIDFNKDHIQSLTREVATAHQLDTIQGLSEAELDTIETEYYGFWQSASDIYDMSIRIYPTVADEFDNAYESSIANIPSELTGSERIDFENEKRREVFDGVVQTIADRYLRARIESFFIQANKVSIDSAKFQKESFALLVQASLLKLENESHITRQLSAQPAKDFIDALDDTTPLIKALDFIAELSNGFHVDPYDEQFFTGERLFWGIKDKNIREDKKASKKRIFSADLFAFLSHIIDKDAFRHAERNTLQISVGTDADGFRLESDELSEFYERRDKDADAIIKKLVPIFRKHIKKKKFVDLPKAASEIEKLGEEAARLFTDSVLGYRYTQDGRDWIPEGIGKLTLNTQLYAIFNPKGDDFYSSDDESRPSPSVTKYRFDMFNRMRAACEKVHPDYKTDPAFNNVMCAFGTVAKLILDSAPEGVRGAYEDLSAEMREIGEREGEAAAKQHVAERIEAIVAEQKVAEELRSAGCR